MKYSICIEPLFGNIPFEDRVKIISEIGYEAVELWDSSDKDLDKFVEECKKYNIEVAACGLNDIWGNRRLNAPTRDFMAVLEETIPNLKKMGCSSTIALTGEIDKNKTIEEQKKKIIETLKEAAKIAESENIVIVVEALNSYVDHKDYFLDSSKTGFEIIKEVGSDSIKLLYDVYHMQIMEGNIISNITDNIDLIGHFHSAGVPGRHELYSGELNYKNIITSINDAGYDKYFGIEYWPSINDKESLKQTDKFLNT